MTQGPGRRPGSRSSSAMEIPMSFVWSLAEGVALSTVLVTLYFICFAAQ